MTHSGFFGLNKLFERAQSMQWNTTHLFIFELSVQSKYAYCAYQLLLCKYAPPTIILIHEELSVPPYQSGQLPYYYKCNPGREFCGQSGPKWGDNVIDVHIRAKNSISSPSLNSRWKIVALDWLGFFSIGASRGLQENENICGHSNPKFGRSSVFMKVCWQPQQYNTCRWCIEKLLSWFTCASF